MRLIDADALMDDVSKRYCKECERRMGIKKGKQTIVYEIGDAPCRACSVDDMKYELETAPTIEECKTGKWEEREVSSEKVIDEWQSARCSVCGKYHTTPYMYYFDNFSFCPNCGADMRGDDHETD